MKIPLTVIALFLSLRASCFAILDAIPDIPVPKLSAIEAITSAEKQLQDDPKYVLVDVQWCLSSSFHPPVTDGFQYFPGGDAPDEYSWFITYVYKDAAMEQAKDAAMEQAIEGSRFSRLHSKYYPVVLFRVKSDGSFGSLISGSPRTHAKYNSVLVVRVKNDGSFGSLIGARF